MPSKFKVTAPVAGFTGEVAGVAFAKGEATTDSPQALAYFRSAGYKLDLADEPESGTAEPATQPEAPKQPGPKASKDEWVAFAVAHGLPEAEAKAMTRDALIEACKEKEGQTP